MESLNQNYLRTTTRRRKHARGHQYSTTDRANQLVIVNVSCLMLETGVSALHESCDVTVNELCIVHYGFWIIFVFLSTNLMMVVMLFASSTAALLDVGVTTSTVIQVRAVSSSTQICQVNHFICGDRQT
jgi:hypothetical protein